MLLAAILAAFYAGLLAAWEDNFEAMLQFLLLGTFGIVILLVLLADK